MSAESEGSYSVAVHGRCIIAHSFKGECFGAAQQALHGCTYIIDAIVEGPKLETGANSLVDICFAEHALHDALGCYHERNLDELDEFAGENTTCERIMPARARACAVGDDAAGTGSWPINSQARSDEERTSGAAGARSEAP